MFFAISRSPTSDPESARPINATLRPFEQYHHGNIVPKLENCVTERELALLPSGMRVIGKQVLVHAIEAGSVPAAAARAWYAEAVEARWSSAADLIQMYAGAQDLGHSKVVVPLDYAGHCLVLVVDYRCEVVLITYAGTNGELSMRKSRPRVRS